MHLHCHFISLQRIHTPEQFLILASRVCEQEMYKDPSSPRQEGLGFISLVIWKPHFLGGSHEPAKDSGLPGTARVNPLAVTDI